MVKYSYIRVSSDEQKNVGTSIETQMSKLIRAGVQKENIFMDLGKSAGVKENDKEINLISQGFRIELDLSNRPEFIKLLLKLKPKDELIFVKWDRIARSIILLEAIMSYCVKKEIILTPLEDTNDQLAIKILAVISQNEITLTGTRNKTGFDEIYINDGWGYPAPYGYIKNRNKDATLKDPNKPTHSLILSLKESEKVRQVFLDIAEGKYYRDVAIAHKLNRSTIYKIIRNRVYLGETRDMNNNWKKTNQVPRIVTEEIFNHANEKLKIKEKKQ